MILNVLQIFYDKVITMKSWLYMSLNNRIKNYVSWMTLIVLLSVMMMRAAVKLLSRLLTRP